jgi:hypothetical protein
MTASITQTHLRDFRGRPDSGFCDIQNEPPKLPSVAETRPTSTAENFNPMPFTAAAQMERDLTEDLRQAGYTVVGGH